MRSKTIARPYARAAFDYAKANGVVAAWQQALGTWAILAENPDINRLAHMPQVSNEVFEALVASFVQANAGEPLYNFLQTVIEHDRFFAMPDMYDGFVALHNASDTVLPVLVTSAVTLSEAQQAGVVHKMETKTGQKVALTCAVDPTLIGGLVIRYGDKIIDASLKYRLSALAHCLN